MAHVLLWSGTWPFFDEIQSHEPYVLCTVADCLKAMRIGDAVGRGNQPEGESDWCRPGALAGACRSPLLSYHDGSPMAEEGLTQG